MGEIVYGVESVMIVFSLCLLMMLVTEEVSSTWLVVPVQRHWSGRSEMVYLRLICEYGELMVRIVGVVVVTALVLP